VSTQVDSGVSPGALTTARRLRNEGRSVEALAALRDALSRGDLLPEQAERAGVFLLREIESGAHDPAYRIKLLGQCTTAWVKNCLAAVSWGRGELSLVTEGGFDTVIQDADSLDPANTPSILGLLPWNSRVLLNDGREPAERIDAELEYWHQVWRIAAERGVSRVIQIGYDWVIPDARGFHLAGRPEGNIGIIRRLNSALRAELPVGYHFLPLEEISGIFGRNAFYDMRRYYWTRQPFSEAGAVLLAEHLFAAIRAVTVGPRKVLALDLDNTLWGGVVGELGPHGICVGETPEGEAFVAFQRYLKSLADRGILLVVCSKNNPEDARDPFLSNRNMVLSLDDFAAFEANWHSKADNLKKIASDLGLGLDTFVFFDDSKAEQEQMRQALAEVAIADTPADPAEYIRAVQNGLWFESSTITLEDASRSEMYRAEGKRRVAKTRARSTSDYLRLLNMRAIVRSVSDDDLARVVQLVGKTNQFNLTNRRHGLSEIRSMIERPGSLGFTVRLQDKFGDHGLVAVLLAHPSAKAESSDTLVIDTFLMSCRVIGRTVEHFMMRHLFAEARLRGYRRVIGEYVPTKKNALVKDLYDSMGMRRLCAVKEGDSTSVVTYELVLSQAKEPASFIQTL
jgi:FkbH-like protein